ncbi:MAG TPA: ATP-binding protein [Tepidisphaeraceae bacterium]|nr:ATP-binding protein [Tepidisphaeraceae bacterium]
MKRIVLTGGPGAGKTIIAARLAAEIPDRLALVPEAATQVYTELQTRWDRLDPLGRRDVQRRIYRLQREQEDRLAAEHPNKTLLLDRGTIDGAAYWPEGAEDYWRDLGTTHDVELARYDAVIFLQTSAALGLYDGDHSNFCRFEDAEAAIASDNLLLQLWSAHPRLVKVAARHELNEKITLVHDVIEQLAPPDKD